MQKAVEDFLAQREREKQEQEQARREARLLELGLYREEEVADDAMGTFDYRDGKRVRRIPLEVTEEEYAAVCAAVSATTEKKKKSWPVWPVRKILFVLAIVFYVFGVVYVLQASAMGSFLGAVYSCLVYATIGSLLLAVSELLRLLQKRCGEVD